jgi:iron complex outermembrane receptor protein
VTILVIMTDFKTGIGYSNSNSRYITLQQEDLGIPEDGIADQSSSKKCRFPETRRFYTC